MVVHTDVGKFGEDSMKVVNWVIGTSHCGRRLSQQCLRSCTNHLAPWNSPRCRCESVHQRDGEGSGLDGAKRA